MTADFLFTWTPSGWPHSELKSLIEDFTAGRKSDDVWRCKAHRKARRGDHAYFLKLGAGEHGIFGVGEITGPASKDVHAVPGQNPWKVPVKFLRLVDPNEMLLVSEQEFPTISKWHPQGSGIRLPENAARSIDELIAKQYGQFIAANTADADAFDPSNLEDARERINRSIAVRRGQQAFRSMLLDAYDRKCAVTGSI